MPEGFSLAQLLTAIRSQLLSYQNGAQEKMALEPHERDFLSKMRDTEETNPRQLSLPETQRSVWVLLPVVKTKG
jgi:hypothetical protein